MKTRIFTLVLLTAFALSFATPTAAAAATKPASIAYSVKTVHLDQNGTTIVQGTSRMTVLRMLGASYRKLSNDTWMYHGFTSSDPSAKEQSCNQLVITFSGGKVTDLKLVNRNAALLIAKGIPLKPVGSVIAAK